MPAYLQPHSRKMFRGLGIVSDGKKVFLFSNRFRYKGYPLSISISEDGLNFRPDLKKPKLLDTKGKRQNTKTCRDFRVSNFQSGYFLTYKMQLKSSEYLSIAFSKDLITWEKIGKVSSLKETGMIASGYKYKGQYVMYFGESEIKLALSNDLKTWQVQEKPVLKARNNYFDNFPLSLGTLIPTPKGIVLIYYVKLEKREGVHYLVGAALLDKKDPSRILWRKDAPILDLVSELKGKTVYPLGALNFKGSLLIYFDAEEEVFVVCLPNFNEIIKEDVRLPVLDKHVDNPIIKPILHHAWESQATFNAAAVFEDGKVHLIYRAIGEEGVSVLGYAGSRDGVNIDERLDNPIFAPTQPFECVEGLPVISFMSGGGYGGCEDPRITRIDDKFYMTYVAFNGNDHPRIAITSIKADDFLNKRWNWATPKLISPPGVVNKNPCLLPEKINGKYVIFHRVFPDILIDFVEDLNFKVYLKGEFKITPRNNFWDSRKIGAGAPPIKTKDGWLLIYHAVGDRDPSRYKIGAMLLDISDPALVLHRSNYPILEPDRQYENEGYKAGVAYPCGAVVVEGRLIVYYGGADTVVCVATKNLDSFLSQLKSSSQLSLDVLPTTQRILGV